MELASSLLSGLALAWAAQDVPVPAPPTVPQALTDAAQAPTSPWRVDYGDQRCIALRNFGSGQEMVTLVLQRDGSTSLRIGLAGEAIRPQPADAEFELYVGENAAVDRLPGYAAAVGNNTRLMFVEWPLDNAVARLRLASTLRFIPPRGTPYHLRLSGIGAVLDRLNHCYDTLLESWGVDLAAVRALRVLPEPINPRNWINSSLLPGFTGEATAAVLLSISAEGRVTHCRTVDSSGLAEVDAAVCNQLRFRARYSPAIGPDGTPVATHLVRRVRYQSPR